MQRTNRTGMIQVQDDKGRFNPLPHKLVFDYRCAPDYKPGNTGAGCFGAVWKQDALDIVSPGDSSLAVVAKADGEARDISIDGNEIGLCAARQMATLGEGKVAAYRRIDRDRFEVRFEKPAPDGIEVGDALENLTWAPDFTVRNSWFGSCRARGLLVSTPGRVVIENNDFVSSGAAILIAGDANGWFESGAVRDVLIRGNRFHPSCLTSWYQFGDGIISILPIIPKVDPALPFHRDIRIEENEFEMFDYSVLYALSVDGLQFTNNTIKHNTKYKPWQGRKAMLTFEACKDVKVSDNKIAVDTLGKNIATKRMDPAEVSVAPGQGIRTAK